MRSSVVMLLAAASVSDAYIQLQFKSNDRRELSLLEDFTLASLVTAPTGNKAQQFTAVRDPSPLTPNNEQIFWASTWMTHNEPGSSLGICQHFPCKELPKAGGDTTLYNMAKANVMRRHQNRRKWNPDTHMFLKHLYFLGFEDKGTRGASMGVFKPHALTSMRSKVGNWVSRTENIPWKFLTFNGWQQIRNDIDIPDYTNRPEFDLDIEGPREWFVCYQDPTVGDNAVAPDTVTAITIDLVTKPMELKDRRCDSVYLHARVFTPMFGKFADVKRAEETRRSAEDRKQSQLRKMESVPGKKLFKATRFNEKIDAILGKPEEVDTIQKFKEEPIDMDDVQIEEKSEEEFERRRQQMMEEEFEKDLETQQNLRGSLVVSKTANFERQKTTAMDGKNWENALRATKTTIGQKEGGPEICVLGLKKKNTWLKRKC